MLMDAMCQGEVLYFTSESCYDHPPMLGRQSLHPLNIGNARLKAVSEVTYLVLASNELPEAVG